jgi:hypothetical protein
MLPAIINLLKGEQESATDRPPCSCCTAAPDLSDYSREINDSRRITVAKNKDSVWRVGVHRLERREAKALGNQNCRPLQPAGAQTIKGLVCLC